MWTLIAVYALLCLGILFCFFGKFPGQILAYAGMLVAYFGLKIDLPVWLLILLGVLAVGSIVLNKTLVPKLAKKVHDFGKAGKWGTTVGSLLSIVILASVSNRVVGLIVFFALPYVFAFIFEVIASKSAGEGAKRAGGAYTLFAASTIVNVLISVLCLMEVICGGKFFKLMFESMKTTEETVEEVAKNLEESADKISKETFEMQNEIENTLDEIEEPASVGSKFDLSQIPEATSVALAMQFGMQWPNNPDFIDEALIETATREFTTDDIEDLPKELLRIYRNYIYARHGYIFKSADLTTFFSLFDWYKPTKSDVSNELSPIEKKNIAFFKSHE